MELKTIPVPAGSVDSVQNRSRRTSGSITAIPEKLMYSIEYDSGRLFSLFTQAGQGVEKIGTFVLRMLKILHQPYPKTSGLLHGMGTAALFGGFVFLFLWVFRPFGIQEMNREEQALILAGYGIITALIIFALGAVFPLLFPDYFNESNWTVLREIIHTLLIIMVIGMVNLWYSFRLGFFDLSLQNLLQFQFITLGVAVIPVTLMVMLRQILLLKKNLATANALTHQIRQVIPEQEKMEKEDVLLTAENEKDQFSAPPMAILYFAAADNYIEIIYEEKQVVKKQLFRCSLKRAEEQLRSHTSFFRCHRTYLVNLPRVKYVTGNAQGYKLHFDLTDMQVPVSRNHNKEISHLLGKNKA